MPTKGSFASNVFEQLEDLGKQGTKATSQAAQTFNPVKIIEEMTSSKSGSADTDIEKAKQNAEKKSSTPLDFNKLGDKYKDNEQSKLTAVRKQFEYVKQEEQRAIDLRKKEEEERTKKILEEEQEKKRKEQEKKKAEEQAPIPQGKQRRSLFSPKKKAQQKHAETKPSVGKQ